MANPFKEEDNPTEQDGLVSVTNSELYCFRCWTVSVEGRYDEENKTLYFTCPRGHNNKIEGIDI